MNIAYDNKRKPKLKVDKVKNSPNQEKTNGSSTKNQKILFAIVEQMNTVSPSSSV